MTENSNPCQCGGPRCTLTQDDRRHGTPTGYGNNRCRCMDCINAWSAYSVTARHKRRSSGLAPGDPRHGTDNGYTNYNCRSTDCAQDGTYGCVQARADARKVAA